MIPRWTLLAFISSVILGHGAEPVPQARGQGIAMDYGPFLSYTINCKNWGSQAPDNLALKGIAIKLDSNTACFDTELLRYAAVWTGGFLDLTNTHLTTYKGSREVYVAGKIALSTLPVAGWSVDGKGFDDPRPMPAGPLSREQGRWRGLYRHGNKVVLEYEIFGTLIRETPEFRDGLFTRHLEIAPSKQALNLLLAHGSVDVAMTSGFAAATNGQVVYVRIGPADQTQRISVALSPSEERAGVTGPSAPNLTVLSRGGPALWPEILTTKGRLGVGGPYIVDTLTVPESNPWKSWLRFIAFDFFNDGRAAVSTWNGDVWLVSGIDGSLQAVQWKRFAAGLHEPLGLRIVNDVIHVLGRDGITRLHDLNADNEADHYENFNNDVPISPSYHAFAMELQTDRAGNFYHVRCGQRIDPALPLNGGLVRTSRDGSRSELVATGLRAANGLCIGPNDEIICADNQGNWIPSSRINRIRTGGFYGYTPHARMSSPPTTFDPPLCWLPVAIDNSSGSGAFITGGKWGPFDGSYVHTSYGKAALFLLMREEVDGQAQGGVVQFPLRFDSGIQRVRFHPIDGQLYVCGLKGWQTAGGRDAAFQRVRYTGQPVRVPAEIHVRSNGVQIVFASELNPEIAADLESWAVQQWNYKWSEAYGSDEYSVARPDKKGRDDVTVEKAEVTEDGRSVLLRINPLQPVMQMRIQYRLKSKDGQPITGEIYNTINRIPGP